MATPTDPSELTTRRPSRVRRAHDEPPGLSMTSLMDMMTIMLVYLLVSISSDPFSIKETTVLRLSRAASAHPAMYTVPLQANKREITVDGRRALTVRCTYNGRSCADDDYGRPEATFSIDPAYKEGGRADSLLLLPLQKALQDAVQAMNAQNAALPDEIRRRYEANRGAATIIADKDLPYRLIAELVYTAGAAGLADIRFAVAYAGGAPR